MSLFKLFEKSGGGGPKQLIYRRKGIYHEGLLGIKIVKIRFKERGL